MKILGPPLSLFPFRRGRFSLFPLPSKVLSSFSWLYRSCTYIVGFVDIVNSVNIVDTREIADVMDIVHVLNIVDILSILDTL